MKKEKFYGRLSVWAPTSNGFEKQDGVSGSLLLARGHNRYSMCPVSWSPVSSDTTFTS